MGLILTTGLVRTCLVMNHLSMGANVDHYTNYVSETSYPTISLNSTVLQDYFNLFEKDHSL